MVEQMKQTATAEKRLGRPEEIADIVAFMAEDGSKWINGDTICATVRGLIPSGTSATKRFVAGRCYDVLVANSSCKEDLNRDYVVDQHFSIQELA